MRRILAPALLVIAALALSGCLAGAVVGTAGRVVGTTAKVAVKTTGIFFAETARPRCLPRWKALA